MSAREPIFGNSGLAVGLRSARGRLAVGSMRVAAFSHQAKTSRKCGFWVSFPRSGRRQCPTEKLLNIALNYRKNHCIYSVFAKKLLLTKQSQTQAWTSEKTTETIGFKRFLQFALPLDAAAASSKNILFPERRAQKRFELTCKFRSYASPLVPKRLSLKKPHCV